MYVWFTHSNLAADIPNYMQMCIVLNTSGLSKHNRADEIIARFAVHVLILHKTGLHLQTHNTHVRAGVRHALVAHIHRSTHALLRLQCIPTTHVIVSPPFHLLTNCPLSITHALQETRMCFAGSSRATTRGQIPSRPSLALMLSLQHAQVYAQQPACHTPLGC